MEGYKVIRNKLLERLDEEIGKSEDLFFEQREIEKTIENNRQKIITICDELLKIL